MRLRFTFQVLLMTLIPCLGLLYFGYGRITASKIRYEQAIAVERNMKSAVILGDLIHSLQLERGYSLQYFKGKNPELKPQLDQYRSDVDIKRGELLTSITSSDEKIDVLGGLQRSHTSIIEKVIAFRTSIDHFEESEEGYFVLYSKIINQYLLLIRDLVGKNEDAVSMRMGGYYVDAIAYKESLGVQRAKLSEAVLHSNFHDNNLLILSEYVSKQRFWFEIVTSQNQGDFAKRFIAIDQNKDFEKIKAYENDLLENGGARIAQIGLNNVQWFELFTEKVDKVRQVELHIANEVLLYEKNKRAEAKGIYLMQLFLVLFILLLTVVVTLMIGRSILKIVGGDPRKVKSVIDSLSKGSLKITLEQREAASGVYKSVINMQQAFVDKNQELKEALLNLTKYKEAIDLSMLVSVVDKKGNLLEGNSNYNKVFNDSREGLMTAHWLQKCLSNPERFMPEVFKTVANKQIWNGEINLEKEGGGKVFLNSTVVPFFRDNELVQLMDISIDISLEKEQLSQIVQKNKQLDQFTHAISHNLKVPLRGISTLSEFIEEDMNDRLEEEDRKKLALLRNRARSLQSLIDDLLAYSKIGRGAKESVPVNTHEVLSGLIKDVLDDDKFKITLVGDFPIIKINTYNFEQICLHLINNAVKYNDKEYGLLEVRSEVESDFCLLRFKDNGPGISSLFHSKIFEVFQRLDNGYDEESTGIGLSIVKRIIDSIGGSITVESQEGRGSTFRVKIPLK